MDVNFSKTEFSTLSAILISGEHAIAYAKQRKLDGAIFYPTIAIATNKRMLILNRWFLRMKSDITVIRYDNIASFRISHGMVFSSIKIRLKGSFKEVGVIFEDEREEGEIRGLTRKDACTIGNVLNSIMNCPENAASDAGKIRVAEGEGSARAGVHDPGRERDKYGNLILNEKEMVRDPGSGKNLIQEISAKQKPCQGLPPPFDRYG